MEPYAYASSANADLFGNFYSDAADYLYLDALTTLGESVTVKEEYYEAIDPVALPYNYQFIVKEVYAS